MTIERHDENDDDAEIRETYRRDLTPTRVLQIKFVGFVNALFNYCQWLIRQNAERKQDD